MVWRRPPASTIVPLVLASGGPVLDAGCGTGWWLARLATAARERAAVQCKTDGGTFRDP